MNQSLTVQELVALARLVGPTGTQRTDTSAADGELNFYVSGSDLVMQVFHRELGWKSTTLT